MFNFDEKITNNSDFTRLAVILHDVGGDEEDAKFGGCEHGVQDECRIDRVDGSDVALERRAGAP